MKPIKFPVAQFHHKYNSLDFMNYKVLMGDRRYVGIWHADIIDSDGYIYKLKEVKAIGWRRIFDSVRLVGNIYKYEPILSEPETKIELEEFKSRVVDYLRNNKKHYSALDHYKNLINEVNSKKDFKSIMQIFFPV